MEDQRPAEGDLTADTAVAAEAVALDETGDTTTESTDAGKRRFWSGRPTTRWFTAKRLTAAAAVAAPLFVGSAAFAGAAVQPFLADQAASTTKTDVASTAARAITTLWTYTPENMDGLADRAATYLGGDLQAQYRKFLDAIVGPNKQAKTTSSTEVVSAAVESLEDRNAVVIVYTNTTSTSPLTKNIPSLKYFSYRMFMTHTGGRWLVTRMSTITSLDLTPHG